MSGYTCRPTYDGDRADEDPVEPGAHNPVAADDIAAHGIRRLRKLGRLVCVW
jgi:hypothetical protein